MQKPSQSLPKRIEAECQTLQTDDTTYVICVSMNTSLRNAVFLVGTPVGRLARK